MCMAHYFIDFGLAHGYGSLPTSDNKHANRPMDMVRMQCPLIRFPGRWSCSKDRDACMHGTLLAAAINQLTLKPE